MSSADENRALERAISESCKHFRKENDEFVLKDLQQELVKDFIRKEDIVAVLPTSYGKSIIYMITPHVLRELAKEKDETSLNPLVIVISPTISLIEDQMQRCMDSNLQASRIQDVSCPDFEGFDVVFGSPEQFIENKAVNILLSNQVLRSRLHGIVIDEAHLVVKW